MVLVSRHDIAGIWVAFFKSASNIVDRWVGFLVGEVVELADSTSIKVYLSLSGNQSDLAINATIALALLCRAGAGGLVALGHDDAATTMYGDHSSRAAKRFKSETSFVGCWSQVLGDDVDYDAWPVLPQHAAPNL